MGVHTNKAWLAGWDAGITGQPINHNPYRRSEYSRAWDKGHAAGLRSDDRDVIIMKVRQHAADVQAFTQLVKRNDAARRRYQGQGT